jgi:predicted 3-demethylubiquinone-9 3-methyltransferase (glyoxalase superfamily)
MPRVQTITPCLWFDRNGEDAAKYYISIFPNSKITNISYYTEAGKEHHHMPAGIALVVAFELDGQAFTALNGGPIFKFTEAVSFQINCDNQQEVDFYWDKLKEGGPPESQQCGWVKDKFGLSWQVVPVRMVEMLNSGDKAAAARAMEAMMGMKKLDIAALEKAFAGQRDGQ